MATTPVTTKPPVKTNRSDVVANFVRYHGRQPKESDNATIDWLTQFSPTQVEEKLAKNSPITNGALWHEYQQQKPAVDNNESWINSLDLTDAEKEVLKFMNKSNDYTSGQDFTPKDLEDVTKAAELDIGTHYNKLKYEDLEKLKTGMADLRNAAARYVQTEALNYKQKLRSTKESLRARGLTFSGTARTQLGSESAVGGRDLSSQTAVEGEIPQERRYTMEDQLAKVQQAGRDMGQAAETRYGSQAVGEIQNQFGTYASPYDLASGNVQYQQGRSAPLYEARNIVNGVPKAGYVASADQTGLINPVSGSQGRYTADWETERKAAIDREAQRRKAALGYRP
jgi:hypothetical protein